MKLLPLGRRAGQFTTTNEELGLEESPASDGTLMQVVQLENDVRTEMQWLKTSLVTVFYLMRVDGEPKTGYLAQVPYRGYSWDTTLGVSVPIMKGCS